MTDITIDIADTSPEAEAKSNPDRKKILLLARALWRVEWRATEGSPDPKLSKEDWKLKRTEKVKQARKLLKAMNKKGLIVELSPEAEASAAD